MEYWDVWQGIAILLFGILSFFIGWYSYKKQDVCFPWEDKPGAYKTTLFWLIMAVMTILPTVMGLIVIFNKI